MKLNIAFFIVFVLSLCTAFLLGHSTAKNREQLLARARFKEVCVKSTEEAYKRVPGEKTFATKREALAEASMLLGAGMVYPAAYLTSKWCSDFDFAEFAELEEPGTMAFCYGYVYRCIARNFNTL